MSGPTELQRVPMRLVTALAIAAACTVAVGAAIDLERIRFALVMTGLVTPGMVAHAMLGATGRPKTGRIAFAAWAVSWIGFMGLSTLASRGASDGSGELARLSLILFTVAAIAAYLGLERAAARAE